MQSLTCSARYLIHVNCTQNFKNFASRQKSHLFCDSGSVHTDILAMALVVEKVEYLFLAVTGIAKRSV